MNKGMFVILSSERTGSNLLVSKLNALESITCHGEIFNPSFVGLDKHYHEITGIGRSDTVKRDQDRERFIEKLQTENQKKILGFKFFPGHGDRTHHTILADTKIKKIFLRRNVIQSYISRKIALESGVWMINTTNNMDLLRTQKEKAGIKVEFKPPEFRQFRKALLKYWKINIESLEQSSQSYFDLWYSNINDSGTFLNLIEFIGCTSGDMNKLPSGSTVKQTPADLKQKVSNYDQLEQFALENNFTHLL